ncbi:hypothetical protein D3C72_1526670 [compost metagenome]
MQQFLFQSRLLLLLEGSALLMLHFFDLLGQQLVDEGCRQELLFLASTDEDVALCRVGQHRTKLAKGFNPAEPGNVLATAGGEGTGFKLGLQLLRSELEWTGETIDAQVFEPHMPLHGKRANRPE